MAAGAPNHGDELYCPTCEQTFARGERCPTDNTRLVRIAQSRDQLIGRELEGRYTITQQLGQGGMGAVYRGTQHQLGREVAIKVVTPSLVKEPLVIKRFLREAKLASRLSHPNAVSVLDFGQTEDGLFFLVMELVAGRTLEDIVVKDGRMPPARVVRIGAQICDALEGAHALQIIHRDLKPQNVMVMATGRDLVKVLDFGLAKSLSPDQSKSTMTMTNAGALLGTPAFMPPELVNGQDCDARSDLYSLGCILYACAAGRLPFPSTSVHEVIAAHASDPPPRIRDIPLRLWSIIEKLLEKDPVARYQSATETREALEVALTTAEPEPPVANIEKATMLGWDGSARSNPSARRAAATPARGVSATARPRVTTPAAGVGVQKISVSPVPVPADQVDQLASSQTMLSDSALSLNAVATVTPVPLPAPIPATPTAQVARPKKPLNWKPIALVLAAAIAAAVIAFVVVDKASSKSKSSTPPAADTAKPAGTDKTTERPAAETKPVVPVKVETKVDTKSGAPAAETKLATPADEAKVDVPPVKVEMKSPTTRIDTKSPTTKKPATKKLDPKQEPKPADVAPPRRPVKTNPGVL